MFNSFDELFFPTDYSNKFADKRAPTTPMQLLGNKIYVKHAPILLSFCLRNEFAPKRAPNVIPSLFGEHFFGIFHIKEKSDMLRPSTWLAIYCIWAGLRNSTTEVVSNRPQLQAHLQWLPTPFTDSHITIFLLCHILKCIITRRVNIAWANWRMRR